MTHRAGWVTRHPVARMFGVESLEGRQLLSGLSQNWGGPSVPAQLEVVVVVNAPTHPMPGYGEPSIVSNLNDTPSAARGGSEGTTDHSSDPEGGWVTPFGAPSYASISWAPWYTSTGAGAPSAASTSGAASAAPSYASTDWAGAAASPPSASAPTSPWSSPSASSPGGPLSAPLPSSESVGGLETPFIRELVQTVPTIAAPGVGPSPRDSRPSPDPTANARAGVSTSGSFNSPSTVAADLTVPLGSSTIAVNSTVADSNPVAIAMAAGSIPAQTGRQVFDSRPGGASVTASSGTIAAGSRSELDPGARVPSIRIIRNAGESEAFGGTGAEMIAASSPSRSDPITDFNPLDRASLGQAIDQFLNHFEDLGGGLSATRGIHDLLIEIVVVAVALTAPEVVHRLLRRSSDDELALAGAANAGADLGPFSGLPDSWSVDEL